ncbi:MAG: hypothetical protein JMDDDDMK_01888 [Acidobacteria bacterium]|nr:hypothetical protein [Acidobacteriota bacterium]
MMIAKTAAALFLAFGVLTSLAYSAEPPPIIELRPASLVSLPGGVDGSGRILGIDSNSPAEWDDAGNLFVFTSSQRPFRSIGVNLFNLSRPALPVTIQPRTDVKGGQWIEATYRAGDGTLYGWYHNEPPGLCANNSRLTAPRIGALVSHDDGLTWQDLGIVLEAPPGSLYCDTKNYFFAGGNGDFSVILDQNEQYFYFFISTYHRQFSEQGVAVARMRFEDRDNPVGKVWKWWGGGPSGLGAWTEPGLGGRVTATFPALIDWHRVNANAFWGPSVHYNTHLETYVMLLNHAVDKDWTQEGIYISFNRNLEDPLGWSAPQRLQLNQQLGWYPQVIGLDGGETDKLAGQVSRLFISGRSSWEIVFYRTDNEDDYLQIPPRPAPRGRGEPIIRATLRAKSEER